MSDQSEEKRKAGLKENTALQGTIWKEYLDKIPCAAYIVENDTDLSVIAGNDRFHALFGCTEEDMRCKYGNRLAALFDPESAREMCSLAGEQDSKISHPKKVKQRIRRNDTDTWIQTEVVAGKHDGIPILFCTSFDITAYEEEKTMSEGYRENMQVISDEAGLDSFIYDLRTGAASLFTFRSVLPGTIADENGECADFIETMIREGIVCPEYQDTFRKAFLSLGMQENKSVCELRVRLMYGPAWERRITWPVPCMAHWRR